MTHQKLAKKILRMVRRDQKARKAKNFDARKIEQIDKKHIAVMKEIVKQYGWPGKSLVGKQGADGAWLLVQHADADLKFQKKCLNLIIDAARDGEIQKRCIAYLTDRILVHQKKEQIYGTQFGLDKKSGKLFPLPIASKKYLHKRRKKMGLEPFRNYKKLIEHSFKRYS